jgi:serine/threonine-protein kinase RsbW
MPTLTSTRKNILVVEDDAPTREALALALEAGGHRAARAANGREALDLLRSGPAPDLIVLDLMMPVLDGWQFRRRQREDEALADIPVVVVSASGDLPERAGALEAVALLMKPVEPGRLLEAIRPLVAGPAGPWWDGGSISPEEREPLGLSLRSRAEVPAALDRVAAAMGAEGFPARDVFAVRLSLEEALVNALKHGHGDDPAREVRVRYRVTSEQALVEVEDQGPGFDPDGVPDPLSEEGLARPSGRGLLLMRHYLSWVRHNDRGNCVTLCKCRSSG